MFCKLDRPSCKLCHTWTGKENMLCRLSVAYISNVIGAKGKVRAPRTVPKMLTAKKERTGFKYILFR